MLDIIRKTRSFRRFNQNKRLSEETLKEFIELARLGGSAANCQPWQYQLVTDIDRCDEIFPHLGWAAYLPDWKGPAEGERPTAYILCLLNSDWLKVGEKMAMFDLGLATQNLLLGAMEKGIGGCRIASFSPKVAELFKFPDNLSLSLVIALGYPVETIVLEDCGQDGNIRYYRDNQQIHHVPKRPLADILFNP